MSGNMKTNDCGKDYGYLKGSEEKKKKREGRATKANGDADLPK